MITDVELAWLAGLMEGEGYFGLRSDSGTAQVKLEMTDEDVVLRALLLIQRVTGKQHNYSVVDRRDKKSHYQQTLVIAIYGKDAIKLMKTLVPLMGTRRRRKIWQTLNGYKEAKAKIDMAAILDAVNAGLKPSAAIIPIKRRL